MGVNRETEMSRNTYDVTFNGGSRQSYFLSALTAAVTHVGLTAPRSTLGAGELGPWPCEPHLVILKTKVPDQGGSSAREHATGALDQQNERESNERLHGQFWAQEPGAWFSLQRRPRAGQPSTAEVQGLPASHVSVAPRAPIAEAHARQLGVASPAHLPMSTLTSQPTALTA